MIKLCMAEKETVRHHAPPMAYIRNMFTVSLCWSLAGEKKTCKYGKIKRSLDLITVLDPTSHPQEI